MTSLNVVTHKNEKPQMSYRIFLENDHNPIGHFIKENSSILSVSGLICISICFNSQNYNFISKIKLLSEIIYFQVNGVAHTASEQFSIVSEDGKPIKDVLLFGLSECMEVEKLFGCILEQHGNIFNEISIESIPKDQMIDFSAQNLSRLKDYTAQYDQTDNGLVLGRYFFVFKNNEYEYSSTCREEATQYIKELYNTHKVDKTVDKLMLTLRTSVEDQDGDCLSVLDEVILWESA